MWNAASPWLCLLLFQMAAGFNAGWAFSHLPRGWAGLLAGGVFLFFGITAFYVFWKRPGPLRFPGLVVTGFFVMALSLPMAIARILTPFDRPVQSVLGFPLQYFHDPSLWVFKIILVLIVGQAALVAFKARKA